MKIRDLLVVGVVAIGGWYGWTEFVAPRLSPQARLHDEIILYSNGPECYPCRDRARQMQAEGLVFTEIRVDIDPQMLEQMRQKLQRAGYREKVFDFPVIDVYGAMLPDNPSLRKIKEIAARP